ncbi:Fc.00g062580.m01.CDS01 [Cosmosporella sp. VM-42]
MPSVDVAMARSLRGGVWDTLTSSLARSLVAHLSRRDIVQDAEGKVTDLKTALSSWDNCMRADFCKWPAIAIMVVGGLIILSIVWCIVRCCCCGMACCCSCFQCLKCCGNCCGCCDPPGGKPHKHLDDPYAPAPHHGYRSEAPMGASIPQFAPKPSHVEPPQYAEFETQKRGGNEDSLPEMPSWDGAGSKKVAVEEDAVELHNLKKSPAPDQQMGVMNGASSGRISPGRSPYAQPQGNGSGYIAGNQPPDHYSPIDQGYSYNSNPPANTYELDQSYTTPAASAAVMGPGRRSPGQNYQAQDYPAQNYNTNGFGRDAYGQPQAPREFSAELPADQGYGQTHTPQNDFGNYDGYRRPSPGPAAAYGTDPRMRQSPGPRQTPNPRRTPGPPHQDSYGYGQPPRRSPAPPNDYAYGQSAPTDRMFSPAPDRQYGAGGAQSPRPLTRPVPQRHYGDEPPQSPITNNSGFDFNSGYARPVSRPGVSPTSPTQEAYPGYKPYQP